MLIANPRIHRPRPVFALDVLQRGGDARVREVGDVSRRPAGAAFNLYRAEGALVLQALLPGFVREALEISVEGGALAIRGERRAEVPEGFTPIHVERRGLKVDRRWRLSEEVDVDAISAALVDGLLTVRLPLREAPAPRMIAID